ncbi:MAG: YraN family protein [Caulobacteraceae bacterium]
MTVPRPVPLSRRLRGDTARRTGRWAEVQATLLLMATGWRILGFRLRTPAGEIDLLAKRGQVLAVVEVKCRASLEAALGAVSSLQQARLRAAGEMLVAGRPDLQKLSVRLDLIALAPGRRPRHIHDAWGYSGTVSPAQAGVASSP